MDMVKTLNRTEYEWLLSGGDKITSELLRAEVHEIGKLINTSSLLSLNCNETLNFIPPLISNANFLNTAKDSLEIVIVKNISRISEVEYILLSKIGNHYEIWIVINKLDREVRDRIYDVEYDILEQFRDTYFDFHVVCRDDRNIEDIFPTDAIIFYRRKL